MFERFTERGRQVIVLASEESQLLKHDYIGTEHILLGLLREEEGLAAKALENRGVSVEKTRAKVVRIVGRGKDARSGQIPFTPRAKKVLESSLHESRTLGHGYIGTEHVLLGLIDDPESVAARILRDLDLTADAIRSEVMTLLQTVPPSQEGLSARTWRDEPAPDARAARTMKLAAARALSAGHDQIEPLDLLHALLAEEAVASLLESRGIDRDALRDAIDRGA